MSLHNEIMEQAAVLENLVKNQWGAVQKIAEDIRKHDIDYVFLAARGTSDNAGRYAQYLWGIYNQLPIALAAPSLFSLYQMPPRLKNALVVGISQSGMSPDIVSVLKEAKRQGCLSVAILNTPESPMGEAVSHVLDISAGIEIAVAATKTYTAELMAIAMLSAALRQDEDAYQTLKKVPGWVAAMLDQDAALGRIAERYRYMDQCVVLGRGFNYSTAFEWSLKMKELCYVAAEPYSSADFLHGPVAVVSQGYPVMAVVPDGKVADGILELLRSLRKERNAELFVFSNRADALDLAQSRVALPADMPEWVSPIVSIVPAQLFAYHLTRVKGYDTENPHGLHKVTETK
ncbi:glutamine--fructose-6-phosphate transaminase [Longilinea arvoryzae]|uniref:Glutamine--fructose-6-phosphate transaminase n=1 Tax=Longilinea arvoryzae TaxID=360412 RepID=A0A0S7BFJ3_9CHLR|nr:SIS domain-containing protein [Longilinea arvoryzae]GAP13748.1 glutamine--fructose-6-phosphate transaminase [Longilinea arvoryzae]